jgi:hypothetical protein
MGKASSAKKVARAARAGGASKSNQRKLMFPIAIAGVVVIGVLLILVARSGFDSVSAESPKPGEHWHQAYGFYVCDSFLPPLNDQGPDRSGIHTHGDGIIHTHPFSNAYAGENATLSVWGETVGVDFGTDSWDVLGETYTNGFDCNGEPAQLAIYKWSIDDPDAPPEVITSDFGNVRLDSDRLAYTFAVVPEGTEVPHPDSMGSVDQLDPATDSVRGAPSSTTATSTLEVPVDPNSTVPGPDPATATDSTPSTTTGDPTATSTP